MIRADFIFLSLIASMPILITAMAVKPSKSRGWKKRWPGFDFDRSGDRKFFLLAFLNGPTFGRMQKMRKVHRLDHSALSRKPAPSDRRMFCNRNLFSRKNRGCVDFERGALNLSAEQAGYMSHLRR